MSDAPEEEAVKAVKTPRKRPAKRAAKAAPAAPAETVVNLSAPEPLAAPEPRREKPTPAPAPAPEPERTRPSLPDFGDGDPVATMGEPPSADSQGSGSKKRRRRKKNKHGNPNAQQQGGGSPQVFHTAPTQGYSASVSSEPREPHSEPAPAHAPVMHAAPRPKLDPEELANKAWKIFLAEVSEEGLALIGDNDARELSRRSFRLAEVFLEEASRRQQR